MNSYVSCETIPVKKIIIYTDGACRGNPGPGGWAALLCYQHHEKCLSGSEKQTTNNRMELMAAIQALASLRQSCHITLYTDSQYVQKGVSAWLATWEKRGWKLANKQPVKNIDLWQHLAAQIQRHHINWYWVKGHSGHPENERVDQLAKQAIDDLLSNTDLLDQ